MPKRKCVFNKTLQQMYPFFKTVEDDSHLHCLKCNGRFSISTRGRGDIEIHIKAKKHQKAIGANSSTENEESFYISLTPKKKPKPKEIEICRICRGFANASNAKNLFHEDQKNLLTQIRDLTDCSLTNESDLPTYICGVCEDNLSRAHSFRTCCLDTQSYFCSTEYKVRLKQKSSKTTAAPNEDCEMKPQEVEQVMIKVKQETNTIDTDEDDILDISNDCEGIELNDITSVKSELECLPDINMETLDACNSEIDFEKPVESNVNDLKKKTDFICDRCGNHFTSRQHFNVHLRRHTNNKPFKCEVCPKECYTPSELKHHMRRHTGERPFACQYCQRRFTDYSTRVRHERTHTNERPYSCSQCGKAFTRSNLLRKHLLVHTGERAFKCVECNKAFPTRTSLVVHCRSIMHRQMVEKQELNKEANVVAFVNENEKLQETL